MVAGSIPVSRSSFSLLMSTYHQDFLREAHTKFHTVHTVHKSMKTCSREACRANRAGDAKTVRHRNDCYDLQPAEFQRVVNLREVARRLSKLDVAGSIPVSRSINPPGTISQIVSSNEIVCMSIAVIRLDALFKFISQERKNSWSTRRLANSTAGLTLNSTCTVVTCGGS